ncbi:host attachment family protein [Methylobacterium sp. NEAU K]|uniref:host attachment family protein n=1 Tax=Methylobacterium sp. NEAU K TaxID=3064946 RepID=UPI002733A07A|nr:host attachment family protein [Methylobacterium sp. NEAU K]MDP4002669.1 host attachment family protein [Methylobacterium sp. NEAU K]
MSDTPALLIPHDGYVLVGDGRKVIVLCNVGHPMKPDLEVRRVFEAPPNPATHDQGTDRPTRVRMGDRRSAIEQTDWHDLAEHQFAKAVAEALGRMAEAINALVIVAPPRVLADLRRELPDALRRVVIGEIAKDLTKHPVSKIESCLFET